MESEAKTGIINGLLRVKVSIERTINRNMVSNSFRKCGIYPYNLDLIINNSNCDVTEEMGAVFTVKVNSVKSVVNEISSP